MTLLLRRARPGIRSRSAADTSANAARSRSRPWSGDQHPDDPAVDRIPRPDHRSPVASSASITEVRVAA